MDILLPYTQPKRWSAGLTPQTTQVRSHTELAGKGY